MSTSKKKPLSPLSIRLWPEERKQIEQGAESMGMSLSDYGRLRLLDTPMPRRRRRNKYPIKDHREFAKLLSELGESRLASNVNQLAKAVNTGSLEVSPETKKAICEACSDIRWMRQVLMAALGLIEEKDHDFERLRTKWSQAAGCAPVKSRRKRAC